GRRRSARPRRRPGRRRCGRRHLGGDHGVRLPRERVASLAPRRPPVDAARGRRDRLRLPLPRPGRGADGDPGGPSRAGRAGPAADGALATRAGCTGSAGAAPGPADPPRALLRLEARAGGGRRALEALVGRDRAPGIPALLWLGAAPGTDVSGTVRLDGADADGASASDSAGLGAPDDPDALDRWLAGEGPRVVSSARTLPALHSPPPPLVALAERVPAPGPRGREALVPTG